MTPEELDEARAKEAVRIWSSQPLPSGEVSAPAAIAARLAREGWTPPEPKPVVDPDVLAFREWLMEHEPGIRKLPFDREWWDNCLSARAYLAGARMAREQERERAKVLVKYVEIDTRRLDGVGGRALDALAKYRGEA